MSEKSQTIGDFTTSRSFQTFPTNGKAGNRRHPRSSEMVVDKSEKSGVFLFSLRVPDFCDGRRSFPTYENSNLSGTSATVLARQIKLNQLIKQEFRFAI